jgi:hypothetical protein
MDLDYRLDKRDGQYKLLDIRGVERALRMELGRADDSSLQVIPKEPKLWHN